MDRWSSAKLCDVANLLLGSSLFFSPWLFGLSAGAQTTIGLFIAVLAVAALAVFAVWEEWQPGRWAVARRLALGLGLRGQRHSQGLPGYRHHRRGTGRLQGLARPPRRPPDHPR
jgi:SPW repeat-containing protein